MMPIFKRAIPLLEKIEEVGFEAYFVGGCVRDYILKKKIADVDIATSATPQEIKSIFSKTIDVGIEHGTVVVIWNKETYELTTFRSDGDYTDFRRPSEVMFIRSLQEDLKRRDFTMNSMAMNKEGKIIDPFSGQEAIRNRLIETVGSAKERFHEDALRMMRAVRFVSQLSFTIANETQKALKTNASLLEKIATERKTIEFEKLLQGENRKQAFQLLLDTELFLFLPGLMKHEQALRQLIQYHIESLSTVEVWSLLLYLMDMKQDKVELFLRKWTLPVKKIKQITSILSWLQVRLCSEWQTETLYRAGLENVLHTEILFNTISHRPVHQSISELKEKYHRLVIKDRHELAVSGRDLMVWDNQEGGPWIKVKLATIEKAVLTGQVSNEKEKIREWLQTCNQS
ncbi:CCA tRNA nucleotidyltransferase [Bacillus sp. V3B]|uniref:CCA tRNA nucleotidyltransferase n=1 Tax=Bacillus sp. V3B TaxID=2804915 RepID=UPI00210E0A8E|nr:CCA tRNA nucleotidyltransferase [Bacillus sp. V3B]MCQ6273901.1 CCA tRNA nucleotidyltransferase [Bacillus sp. V3B]